MQGRARICSSQGFAREDPENRVFSPAPVTVCHGHRQAAPLGPAAPGQLPELAEGQCLEGDVAWNGAKPA